MSEHASSEEHLGLSDSVQIRIDLQVVDHHADGLLAVDKVLRDHVRAQNLVSVTELLEWHSAKQILSMTISQFLKCYVGHLDVFSRVLKNSFV